VGLDLPMHLLVAHFLQVPGQLHNIPPYWVHKSQPLEGPIHHEYELESRKITTSDGWP
jgi:hypothetical protein